MKYRTILQKTLLSIAIATTLTACFSNDNKENSLTPTPASTIGGAVGKGIIKKGIITAVELKADGSELGEVGSAVTDDNGAYKLTLASSYKGGAILIKLTSGADTTMVCDALEGCGTGNYYGNDISADFEMQAISPPTLNGKAISVQVTPFSHMAAANAQKSMEDGKSAKIAVSDAVTQINQITGVNILTTKPVDITKKADIKSKKKDEQKYALLNAAFADVAYENDSLSLQETLDKYAEEFADGVFDADDDDGAEPSEKNLSALLVKLASQVNSDKNLDLSKATKDDTKEHIAIIKGSLGDYGSYDPEPTDNTNKTEIEKAKALISETRTWLTSFNELESPAVAFGTDIETISTTLNSNTAASLEAAMKAVEIGTNAIVDAIENDTELPASATVLTDNDVTITDIETTGTQTSYKLSATDLAGVKMNFSLSIDKPLTELEVSREAAKGKTLNITLSGSASNDKISTTLNESVISIETLPATSAHYSDSNDNYIKLKSLSLTGGITFAILEAGTPTGDEISADATIKFVNLNAGVQEGWNTEASVNLQRIKLGEAKVTNAEGSTAGLTIDLTIDNAASIDTFSFLKNDRVVNFYKYYSNDPLKFRDYEHGLDTFISGSYDFDYNQNKYITYFTGTKGNSEETRIVDNDPLKVQDFLTNAMIPSKYIDADSIRNIYAGYNSYGTGMGASFRVDSKETAESFIKGSLLLSGNMSLKGQEPATVAMTVNRTGYEAGNVSVKLAYDGSILDIDVSNTTLTTGTANGTKMIVTRDGGNVTVDEKEVATISDSNNVMIIRYNDGTFESLFSTAGLKNLLAEEINSNN